MDLTRALHIFPLFGQDLLNGSERYAYLLTEALADEGVDIDVYTTCARRAVHLGGFSLDWPNDLPPGRVKGEAFDTVRFPTRAMPRSIGVAAERAFAWFIGHARQRLGPIDDDSPELADYQSHVMAAVPKWCDRWSFLCRGPISLPMYRELKATIQNYDVVLVSFFPLLTVPAVVRLAQRLGKPVIVLPFFHAADLTNNSHLLGRAVERADAVLCLTSAGATRLKQLYPKCAPVEVGGGVDERGLDDSAISGTRFREKHGLVGREIVLVVGRKEAGKRYQTALDAFRALERPAATLVLLGEDVDRIPIEQERVMYLGRVSTAELWDAFDACDVLVHCSRLESFGFIFLEAWARGKPVIGDALCPAVAALIEDGVDGFLCRNYEAYAERMLELLDNAAMRQRFGEAGRAKVHSKYTWTAVAAKVRQVYERVRKC